MSHKLQIPPVVKALCLITASMIVVTSNAASSEGQNSGERPGSGSETGGSVQAIMVAQIPDHMSRAIDYEGMRDQLSTLRPQVFDGFQEITQQIFDGERESARSALDALKETKLKPYERVALHCTYALLFFKEKNYQLSIEHYRSALKLGIYPRRFRSEAKHTIHVLEETLAEQETPANVDKSLADETSDRANLEPSKRAPKKTSPKEPEEDYHGLAVVGFSITEKGSTKDIFVLYSLPPGRYERKAIKEVRRDKYDPVLVDGEPIRVEGMVRRIYFRRKK